MAKVEKSFVAKVLANLNKSEAELQEEKVIAFVEDATIECEAQIANYKTSLIPGKQLEIKRLEKEVEKSEKNYEEVKFKLYGSFSSYIDSRNVAEQAIYSAKMRLSGRVAELEMLNEELSKFEAVLADLKS